MVRPMNDQHSRQVRLSRFHVALVALAALAARYEPYRLAPPQGPVLAIDVERWVSWSAAG